MMILEFICLPIIFCLFFMWKIIFKGKETKYHIFCESFFFSLVVLFFNKIYGGKIAFPELMMFMVFGFLAVLIGDITYFITRKNGIGESEPPKEP